MSPLSLTVPAEYPAYFALFEGAVHDELVGESPLGQVADERVLLTLNQGGRGYPCSSWVEVERQRRWLPWCEDRATCRCDPCKR
eukprot:3961608-Pleurochrysis_carterae.AAC.1